MPPHDLERADHHDAQPRPPTSRPSATKTPDVVQPKPGQPCSACNPEPYGTELEVAAPRSKPADQRRCFFRDDSRCAEGEILPKTPEGRVRAGIGRGMKKRQHSNEKAIWSLELHRKRRPGTLETRGRDAS